ncbi:MAG: hypothetical protein H6823_08390 [Planctomycetaceae bacterium]|nr:hypothetical protein [Planctomycetales bacterium]MCB9938246.1 hypothetical protein [Planctomycetaceae bacterium]
MTTQHTTSSTLQRGITLLEMLLVLGLLVVIAALAMPSVNRPLETYRLRKSADLIRAEWAKARAKAMETGRTYVFRYEPEADGYMVEPWYSDEDYLESSTMTGAAAMGTPIVAPPPQLFDDATSATMKHLPEEIVFAAGETTQDARDLLAVQGTDALVNQNASMSAPVFFYPDGTSSTARLFIKNPRDRYIKLSLRGLTGVVYVSDLLSGEQVE